MEYRALLKQHMNCQLMSFDPVQTTLLYVTIHENFTRQNKLDLYLFIHGNFVTATAFP